ncbi:Hypp8775 [Branchiostoma lanceolatum]|uniref:Hypp8775 protein n=1 Tax=Branchiostoma lanceolatum TaxID=7740 RepID=A0A8J9Z931_BRALA|nr:Hypp8775 [Branchiostoma lanceolatum]
MADGTMTSSNKEKTETLNNFFCNIFTEEDTDHMPRLEAKYHGPPLKDIPITPEIIMKKLKKLKMEKSPGPDKWHPKILAEVAEAVAKPLAIILADWSKDCQLRSVNACIKGMATIAKSMKCRTVPYKRPPRSVTLV